MPTRRSSSTAISIERNIIPGMNGDLITRTATVNDAAAIQRLLRAAMLTYCADSGIKAGMLEAMTESLESVEDRIRNNNCIAVFDGETAVGTITAGITSEKTGNVLKEFKIAAYVSRFAVIQGLRREGLGVGLMAECEDYARQNGCDVMILHCSTKNAKMTAFYNARGFELIDSENSRGYPRGLFVKRL